MEVHGKKVWFFPDGDRPPQGESPLKGHESIIILNPNGENANCCITFYFEDTDPIIAAEIKVAAERVRCVQTHKESVFGNKIIPESKQYALKVESDVPVIVQYGRLDARQNNLAYYTVMGY